VPGGKQRCERGRERTNGVAKQNFVEWMHSWMYVMVNTCRYDKRYMLVDTYRHDKR